MTEKCECDRVIREVVGMAIAFGFEDGDRVVGEVVGMAIAFLEWL
jgi:hypothetical protein